MHQAQRVLLLMPTTSYKAADFLAAASRLGVDVVVGAERRQALEEAAPGGTLTFDPRRIEDALALIGREHQRRPFAAVIGTDDETVLAAALAARRLGLPHNPPDAVAASRDKFLTRQRLAAAGLRGPACRLLPLDEPPERVVGTLRYPCVVKPLALSASRGVLRVDDGEAFLHAFARVAEIARGADGNAAAILVEEYILGHEVALEGLLSAGRLAVLALFDKPDPLEGPTFEETLYVTPSRHPRVVQAAIAEEAAAACRALGLVEGPVHAELRVRDGQPWLLEAAARTIGGLCSHALRFGAGVSLEELILRHALGLDARLAREAPAAGVMMIPTPGPGVLARVAGQEAARAVPGIEELTISLHPGAELVPLPEGHRYLGFLVARGASPEEVERSLRQAHALLDVVVERNA